MSPPDLMYQSKFIMYKIHNCPCISHGHAGARQKKRKKERCSVVVVLLGWYTVMIKAPFYEIFYTFFLSMMPISLIRVEKGVKLVNGCATIVVWYEQLECNASHRGLILKPSELTCLDRQLCSRRHKSDWFGTHCLSRISMGHTNSASHA